MNATQRKIDFYVVALTVAVAISVIGMFFDNSAIMFLMAPLIVALLLYMSTAEAPSGPGKGPAVVAIHIFNLAHAAVWVGMLVTLGIDDPTFWGLPPATGLMVYVLWPMGAIAAGLLYAYVSKKTGVIERLENDGEASTASASTEGGQP